MTDRDWAAGLFEGEGCITYSRGRGPQRYPQLKLAMCDEDIVRRFHAVVGVGKVYLKKPGPRSVKVQYAWQLTGRKGTSVVMRWMYRRLGERRRARWDEVVAQSGRQEG